MYYSFDDMININGFNPKDIKADAKSYIDVFIYYNGHDTLDGVTLLYIIFNKMDGHINDNNGSKYSILIPVNENKGAIKRYKEIWDNIKDFFESENNVSGDYDYKYMKARYNLDDNLQLKKD